MADHTLAMPSEAVGEAVCDVDGLRKLRSSKCVGVLEVAVI